MVVWPVTLCNWRHGDGDLSALQRCRVRGRGRSRLYGPVKDLAYYRCPALKACQRLHLAWTALGNRSGSGFSRDWAQPDLFQVRQGWTNPYSVLSVGQCLQQTGQTGNGDGPQRDTEECLSPALYDSRAGREGPADGRSPGGSGEPAVR